ncbi:MAG: PilZ domain-containing protein [Lachnospiraceae bacterium]
MIEKRKGCRIPFHLTLSICDLYKQEVQGIHNLDAPIVITDVSPYGVGFTSECILPTQYYFNATMEDEHGRIFTTPLKIIRCSIIDHTHYAYGCKFVALSEEEFSLLQEYVLKFS